MKDSKITPRIAQTAKGLWGVYVLPDPGLPAVAFQCAGMSTMDAVIRAFSTLGLGGLFQSR